jgi:hypothetical protein
MNYHLVGPESIDPNPSSVLVRMNALLSQPVSLSLYFLHIWIII